jgi:hypothetical protein
VSSRQKAVGRKQKAEGSRQKAEGRNQKVESRRQWAVNTRASIGLFVSESYERYALRRATIEEKDFNVEPPLMPLMRQQHEQLALNADHALAWHECAHAVAASALGRLICVHVEPFRRAYVDREGIKQDDDERIAAMGPAAQLAYMVRFRKGEPSSCFLDQWVYPAATEDLKQLSQSWPAMRLEEEEWRARIWGLSRLIQQSTQISDVLKLLAETLFQKKVLSAEAVGRLARDSKKRILGTSSQHE